MRRRSDAQQVMQDHPSRARLASPLAKGRMPLSRYAVRPVPWPLSPVFRSHPHFALGRSYRSSGPIQEALDAAWGIWPDDDDPLIDLTVPRQPRWRELAARARPASRRAARWACGLFTAALAVVIGSLVYSWLSSH